MCRYRSHFGDWHGRGSLNNRGIVADTGRSARRLTRRADTRCSSEALNETPARKGLEKVAKIPRDFGKRDATMNVSQILRHVVDRPFSRAKMRNLCRGPTQLKPRFRVQK